MTKPPLTMVDNVSILPCITSLSVPVERLLKGAADAQLTSIVIIGYEPNGNFYFVSSEADGGSVLWDMELAKTKLLATVNREVD